VSALAATLPVSLTSLLSVSAIFHGFVYRAHSACSYTRDVEGRSALVHCVRNGHADCCAELVLFPYHRAAIA
jgi:hypothetical protein